MQPDVLVIGAGINGLLAALVLAREGLRVSVAERGEAARESTWAGAGILSPLLPWDYGPEVNALAERGRALWPEWIAHLRRTSGVDPQYRQCGMAVLSPADKAGARAWCDAHAWPVADLPPELGLAAAGDALWLPDVAQVRNPRLAQALVQAFLAEGVRILTDTPVLGLERSGDRVRAARTPAGDLVADAFVVAAGAWSQALLGEAALSVDIRPVRGQILLLEGDPGLLPCIVYQDGRYLVPRQDGLVLVGSTLEMVGFDKSVTAAAREELLAFALAACPALRAARPVHHWAGLRPGSPGNVPTVSAHPSLGNLFLDSGHFRYGVTMAPASAELLRDLMLGRAPCLDPSPYRWPMARAE
jgi:glycine oxidase